MSERIPKQWISWLTYDWLSWLAILGVSLLLRSAFAVDQVLDESVALAEKSWNLAQAGGSGFLHQLTSLPGEELLPVFGTSLVYRVIGASPFSTAIFPTLLSLGIGISIFCLGRLLWGRTAGLLATFFWLTLPIAVFLSPNLLPVLGLIFLNTLGVLLYISGKKSGNSVRYFLAFLILAFALIAHWQYAASSVGFILLDTVYRRSTSTRKNAFLLLFVVAGVLLLQAPGNGVLSLDLYYLVRLIKENLVLFPLLTLIVVYATYASTDARPQEALLWLSAKGIMLLVGARWIAEDPLIARLGMSGYWLDFLVPVALLFGWTFGQRVTSNALPIITGLSLVGIVILLVLGPAWAFPPFVFTISRVLFGLSLVALGLLIASWSSGNRLGGIAFAIFVGTFLFGGFTLINDYWISYRTRVDNSIMVFNNLQEDGHANVFIPETELLIRFRFMFGFETMPAGADLTIYPLDSDQANSVPAGAYVLMSEYFRNYVFGLEPETWHMIQSVGDTEQQKLLVYRVTP